jgi:predicted Zn-dependent protease
MKIFKLILIVSLVACSTNNQKFSLLESQSEINQIKSNYETLNNAYVSQYLNLILSKISRNTSINEIPEVTILKSNELIALSSQTNEIILSAKLIKKINSESQLAFILAHELAHIISGDNSQIWADPIDAYSKSKKEELQADQKALEYIIQAGYDPRQALMALAQIYSSDSVDTDNESHPELADRLFTLQKIIMTSEWSPAPFYSEREFKKFKSVIRSL